ncbi:MAG: dihydroorotate dehydrogenase [Gemmatimonadetes bacterium]|nr:dihydroorotate dehydrogenase [Gemmatimonadota bacterium]MCY3678892.1 dihydroorotate dehydrogenase [Gemmatimonadota bacterium]MYA40414.1 dihydroorotate dehydrogenase [Gemmatimonadota bacterium]MYE95204.1 dihydroorotate dehydrogenase [Gemmatimonadota bacterium]MYJ09037.1 dihydroorotate dehydrogenase [Gemmatimonadota bacterium]
MSTAREVFGTRFANPVLMAAGTCGFGEPLVDVMTPGEVGGLVTKSVTLAPRRGNAAPRVTEYPGGMLNSVGLANPGLKGVRDRKLPWMRRHLGDLPVLVSVAGATADEYEAVVGGLEEEEGFCGFELNLSCPNDAHLHGTPFCLDADAMRAVLDRVRPQTARPLLVKLAPNDPDIGATAALAVACGADGITAINTLPGLLSDAGGKPRLGAGQGGMSGPALLPAGLAAVRQVAEAVDVPVVGVGGILTGGDAATYLAAGASLVQVGTGSFADPRCAGRVARQLAVRNWGA